MPSYRQIQSIIAPTRKSKPVTNALQFAMRPGQRILTLTGFVTIAVWIPDGGAIALRAISEAYLAVAVFVAGTMMLLLGAERCLKTDLGRWLDQRSVWQVPASTLLGALPGCGGAIIVVTQFSRGYLSFGSVVATLIATMGDAMFLLLAREPRTALWVLSVSVVAAFCSGYLVDLVHGKEFLRPAAPTRIRQNRSTGNPNILAAWRVVGIVWLALFIPGITLGILGAFQVDINTYAMALFQIPIAHWLGVAGSFLGLVMWAVRDDGSPGFAGGSIDETKDCPPLLSSVMFSTNLVMAWVIFAFVGYELVVAVSGLDLAQLFIVWAPVVPALAILVGFVPGCGPQIIVTSLYLSGTLPLSAQFGNAIANDGDALFPAIAVAPKAALLATLYSAIPAAVVAYIWHLLREVPG